MTHRLPAMKTFTDLRPALDAADMAGPGAQTAVHGSTARNVGVADGIAHAMEAAGAASAAGFGILK